MTASFGVAFAAGVYATFRGKKAHERPAVTGGEPGLSAIGEDQIAEPLVDEQDQPV